MPRNILIADLVNFSVENRNIKIEIHIRGKLADWRYFSMFIKPSPYLTFLWIFRPFHLMDMLKAFLNPIEITFAAWNLYLNCAAYRYRTGISYLWSILDTRVIAVAFERILWIPYKLTLFLTCKFKFPSFHIFLLTRASLRVL